jgi:hypothetical protein
LLENSTAVQISLVDEIPPYHQKEILAKMMKEMLEGRLISPSQSPGGFASHFGGKERRFVEIMRGDNSILKKQKISYPALTMSLKEQGSFQNSI